MPELPEVETVVRTLRPKIVGRSIQGVRLGKHRLRTPWQVAWNRVISQSHIVDVHRRGKWILLELSRPQYRLIVHLGMTGRLLIQAASSKPLPHTHLVFKLDKGDELRYHDPRRFGSVTLAKTLGEHRFPEEASLGPEPFDITLAQFSQTFMKSKRTVKAILLDQSMVAGVGNIYADEALFAARINPHLTGTQLSPKQFAQLRRAMVNVLTHAIEAKGSTIANFYYGDNESGGFQNEFKVYDRTEEPCPRCGTPIKRVRLGGRSTHFCPACQR